MTTLVATPATDNTATAKVSKRAQKTPAVVNATDAVVAVLQTDAPAKGRGGRKAAVVVAPTADAGAANADDSAQDASDKVVSLVQPSRVRYHLNDNNINKSTFDLLSKLQSQFDSTTDKTEQERIHQEMETVRKNKYRITKGTSLELAQYSYEMIHQLMTYGLSKVVPSKKRSSLTVASIVSDGVENLSLYTLFHNLPSFVSARRAPVAADAATVEQPAEPQADAVAHAEADAEETNNYLTFNQASKKIFLQLRAGTPAYASFSVKQDVHDFMSNLVIEFINRISPLTLRMVPLLRSKSISEELLRAVIDVLFLDNGVATGATCLFNAVAATRLANNAAAQAQPAPAAPIATGATPAAAPVAPAVATDNAPAPARVTAKQARVGKATATATPAVATPAATPAVATPAVAAPAATTPAVTPAVATGTATNAKATPARAQAGVSPAPAKTATATVKVTSAATTATPARVAPKKVA